MAPRPRRAKAPVAPIRRQLALPVPTSPLRGPILILADELQAELGFWQQQLQGASPALPYDRPNGGQQHDQALTFRSKLDRALTRQLLQDAPAAYRTQVNDVLLTAQRVQQGQIDHVRAWHPSSARRWIDV